MKRLIAVNEIQVLREKFGPTIPASLLNLLSQRELIKKCFALSEEEDASGIGVDMQWMTPEEQMEEAFKFYPGIEAFKKGYIPVGICLQGSGDPYFVREENDVLKLYRIPHESVVSNGLLESSIEYVCVVNVLIEK